MSFVRFCLFVALSAGMLTPAVSHAGSVPLSNAVDLPDVVARLMPSVVNISVLKRPPGKPEAMPEVSLGSGFVISADGHIVTNKHVVDDAYAVTVAFNDGATYPADILSTNQRPDLALLKVDTGKPLPFVGFGDSDALRIGEPVVAIGNPLGLSSSVSSGVISALNRDINVTMIDDFIQTDAAINHGNSGGPLFNMKGEVIGVNWALFAPGQQSGSAGLGFAIPSNDAAFVIGEMRRFGRLRPGFIGLRIQQITFEMQGILKVPSRSGGIVTAVAPNTPASRVGLQAGDVIIAMNGRQPRDVRSLLRDLGESAPQSQIALKIWRDGTMLERTLTVVAWPENTFNPAGPPVPALPERPKVANLGLALASEDDTVLPPSPFHTGRKVVAITGVLPDSPAADVHLAVGNAIIAIGPDQVATPEDVTQRLEQARAAGQTKIMLLIENKDGPDWVVARLDD